MLFRTTLALFLALLITGCQVEDPVHYQDEPELAALRVTPIKNPTYQDQSDDPYLDGAYIVTVKNPALLIYGVNVQNMAPAGEKRLVVDAISKKTTVVPSLNDIENAELILTVNDPAKVTLIQIGPEPFLDTSFSRDSFEFADRLNGYSARLPIGRLQAQETSEFFMFVFGQPGLKLHLDAVGYGATKRLLFSAARAGTTFVMGVPDIFDISTTLDGGVLEQP